MVSDKIQVDGTDESLNKALEYANSFADSLGLPKKEIFHIRLLTEELLGLLAGITNRDYDGAYLWFEGGDGTYRLHLAGRIFMTAERRAELLASSTSGKNAAVNGIIDKIRDMVARGILNLTSPDSNSAGYIAMPLPSFYLSGIETPVPMIDTAVWTLSNYRKSLIDSSPDPYSETLVRENRTTWDELERSIIANIADDVMVNIQKDNVEITVLKSY